MNSHYLVPYLPPETSRSWFNAPLRNDDRDADVLVPVRV